MAKHYAEKLNNSYKKRSLVERWSVLPFENTKYIWHFARLLVTLQP